MAFPLINGTAFAFANIEVTLGGLLYVGFKSINYSDSLGRKFVYGTQCAPIAITRGHYDGKGDIELYVKSSSPFLLAMSALGAASLLVDGLGGYYSVPFVVTVTYGPVAGMGIPLIVDTLLGCFITSIGTNTSEGDEPITRKFGLMITQVSLGGQLPPIIENPVTLAAIG